ncbi:MAG TPA: class I SAM-dependent methyltransferase, partial [Caulobacteraceae bacterium]|nr:class I SAM-dependent methyltransferase [Caulobacteraceae bacterium]
MAIDPGTLAHWNEVTPHHVVSPMYRTEDFRRGEIVLDPVVRDAIGEVAGKRLHLQCHFGLDTLSLARMGASVTGLDFSIAAIDQARALATEAGIAATFIVCDVLDPPANLTGFDVVFASWGAIYWISDLERWMRVAADALA